MGVGRFNPSFPPCDEKLCEANFDRVRDEINSSVPGFEPGAVREGLDDEDFLGRPLCLVAGGGGTGGGATVGMGGVGLLGSGWYVSKRLSVSWKS